MRGLRLTALLALVGSALCPLTSGQTQVLGAPPPGAVASAGALSCPESYGAFNELLSGCLAFVISFGPNASMLTLRAFLLVATRADVMLKARGRDAATGSALPLLVAFALPFNLAHPFGADW